MAIRDRAYNALQCPLCLATDRLLLEVKRLDYSFTCHCCGALISIPRDYTMRQVKLLLAYRLPDPSHPHTDYEYN